ncbi:hypothetical protein J8L85_13665 [Maribacter sp. MMG018]|uniref:hypothetical protein n=1 Tax=Maribacter sp. MMG018 TaxID=2822688 RepID=UPI001B384A56|nr:hypothetical protein [Maribacter sp. MMG018]MBQ4915497.1 hypothetical protein [Maribacter sp. MMG018]
MKKIILISTILISLISCKEKKENKKELTDSIKAELIAEFKEMKEKDQLNRSYVSLGTFDQKLIDSTKELTTQEYISFMQSHKSELTKKQEDSLWNIQNKIDLRNTNRLYEITKEYGWLSKTKLDSVIDPMLFLFHTPKETIDKMQALLMEEVKANRMEPIKFATYVDNMRKKAFGKNQLYGTGDEFDPKTNSIVPPFIENIDSTNIERKKIGLPELKEGEYRTEK